jgi:hypothetical protein
MLWGAIDLKRGRLAFSRASYSVEAMKTLSYTYWQDGDAWLGHLEDFPDYLTQGDSLEDLKAHLLDLYSDLASGEIPCGRVFGTGKEWR